MTNTSAPWTGRILHVDLSTGTVGTLSSFPHVLSYLGGRGLAARLAWDMIPPGIGAFDPENPLLFMLGALVGTPAPSAGRTTITGLSPQAHPDEWYTRANVGGHWGAELKFAGYDGLIVVGESPGPVYLSIDDDRVSIEDADGLWGLGLIETQRRLAEQLGRDWRALAIGPAGENRCRYAVIATGTESAAGQGGFGAVMGSKKLKAIAVRGSGGVSVAQPREALRRSRRVLQRIIQRYGEPSLGPSSGVARFSPCTHNCPRACGVFRADVQGVVHPDSTYSGQLFCSSPRFKGGAWLGAELGFEAGFELSQVANDLGLNHWELLFGLIPWILACQERGELLTLEGDRLDFTDPGFWHTFMQKIAFREGWGDLLAEGGPRVAAELATGEDLIGRYYPAWGQASHWDGHGSFSSPYFPFWLVTALQWALDTRDPIGGGHGYTTNVFGMIRKVQPRLEDAALWSKIAHAGAHLYGEPLAADPRSGYGGKASPAVLHQDSGALKDSLGICDNIFPMLLDPAEDDLLVRLRDGEGEPVEGGHLEHYLFEPISHERIARDAFYRIGARVYALERLLAIRNWGRSRATDETIIAYLQHPEGSVNPYLGEKQDLDAERFRALLDEVYAFRGWDPATGVPTTETLRALQLDDLGS